MPFALVCLEARLQGEAFGYSERIVTLIFSEALDKSEIAVSKATDGLECLRLKDIDESQFGQFQRCTMLKSDKLVLKDEKFSQQDSSLALMRCKRDWGKGLQLR